MLTTLRQREKRENLKLKLIQVPIPPKKLDEITAAFEKGISDRTRLILISHMINITGQITPVKAVCDLARSHGIETIVDGAHSFAQFCFNRAISVAITSAQASTNGCTRRKGPACFT